MVLNNSTQTGFQISKLKQEKIAKVSTSTSYQAHKNCIQIKSIANFQQLDAHTTHSLSDQLEPPSFRTFQRLPKNQAGEWKKRCRPS